MKYAGIRESFPAREKSSKPRKLSEDEKKKVWENKKKLLKRFMVDWTPKKCRERIEILKRSWTNPHRKEEIALIKEHLKSIGKD